MSSRTMNSTTALFFGSFAIASACNSNVEMAAPSPQLSAPAPIATQPMGSSAAPIMNMIPGPGSLAGSATSAPVPPAAAASDGVPCEVASVVSTRCTQCHGAVPKFGATMALMTVADFHAPAKSDPARKVFEVIPERIAAPELNKRMPPSPNAALPDMELAALDGWSRAGATAVATACAITEGTLTPAPMMGAIDGSGTQGPATAISTTPLTYDDPNIECFKFLAHAQGSKTDKYMVSTQPDLLVNFTFMPTWKDTRYVRMMKAIIDEDRVVHHWLLYRTGRAGTDGSVMSSTGIHPDGALMHGWAPGGSDLYFREDMAVEMPGDVAYALEFHYNNATGAPVPDQSGIEVCVTTEAPEHVLGNSWLGTDRLSGTSVTGTCDPQSDEPIQILAVQPHMHKTGTHFKAIINRAGGMEEVLHDAQFSFDDQRYYIKEVKLMPGDTITSTCTYNAPATYGASTNQEMCYLYALYYPRLALTNGNQASASLHGPDTCLQ